MGSVFSGSNPRNFSLFTVPAVYLVTILLPHVISLILSGKAYDNANPRALRDNLAKAQNIDSIRKQRILRLKSASENGLETLGFYAAGVAVANYAGIRTQTLNGLTLGYAISRVLYVFVYVVLGGYRQLSGLRSLMWQASFALILTLWFMAAVKNLDSPAS